MGNTPTIGVKGLCYAVATVAADGSVTYGTVKPINQVQKIGLSVASSQDKYYADDSTVDIINNFDSATVTIDTYGLDNATLAELEGHTVDANGIMVEKSSDEAPYIALGFKSLKRNSKYRLVWLLLGKKQNDNEEYETIKDKQDPKSATSTFQFVPRADKNWRYKVDEDDATVAADILTKFFTNVYDGTLPA